MLTERLRRCFGKRVTNTSDDLCERQVRIGDSATDEPRAGSSIARQHFLEIVEELRNTMVAEIFRTALRGCFLILVIETGRDRMVHVVRFDEQICDGQLQLMYPKFAGFIARRELQGSAEVQQDVRSLADELLACFEKRRRKWRVRYARAFEKFVHGGHAATAVLGLQCDVDVFR